MRTDDVEGLIEQTAKATEDFYADDAGCCGGNGQSHGCGCHGPAAVEQQWEDKLRSVINKVRPFLQMDGGDMELLAIEDKNAIIRLTGACHGCPSATAHMKQGVEVAIKKEIPDFGELITVEI